MKPLPFLPFAKEGTGGFTATPLAASSGLRHNNRAAGLPVRGAPASPGRILANLMIDSILTICTGNICRSPFAEAVLREKLPGKNVSSAGIGALVGHPADDTAQEVAAALGYDLSGHVGRQISGDMLRSVDLVLAMDLTHLNWLHGQSPESRGKIFLLGRWADEAEVVDPYRRARDVFERVFDQIVAYSEDWAQRL